MENAVMSTTLSFFSLPLGQGFFIVVIAFAAEYMDSTLGMGYGTSLTPILLLLGFSPMEVVPAILLSELVTGLLAGFTHHSLGNVDFKPKTMSPAKIIRGIRTFGFTESYRRGLPLHLRIVLLIASCSIIGTLSAVVVAISLPVFYVKLYIGILISGVGIFILLGRPGSGGFSWKKITCLGLLASFNKGISGGGYGPVVTGGQILSGINSKNAVAVTSMAEGLTCLVGVLTYLAGSVTINWTLAPYLLAGAVASVPLSAFTVKIMKTGLLHITIGSLTVFLGGLTLIKLLV